MPADVQETSDLQHREQHLVAPDDDVLNGPDLIVLVVAAAIETAPEKAPPVLPAELECGRMSRYRRDGNYIATAELNGL